MEYLSKNFRALKPWAQNHRGASRDLSTDRGCSLTGENATGGMNRIKGSSVCGRLSTPRGTYRAAGQVMEAASGEVLWSRDWAQTQAP